VPARSGTGPDRPGSGASDTDHNGQADSGEISGGSGLAIKQSGDNEAGWNAGGDTDCCADEGSVVTKPST
jgi:hypothetical protein